MDRPAQRLGQLALAACLVTGTAAGLVAARAITDGDVWMSLAAGARGDAPSFDVLGARAAAALVDAVGVFGLRVVLGLLAASAPILMYVSGRRASLEPPWAAAVGSVWAVTLLPLLAAQDLVGLAALPFAAVGWGRAARGPGQGRANGVLAVLLALGLAALARSPWLRLVGIAAALTVPLLLALARAAARRASPRAAATLALCLSVCAIGGTAAWLARPNQNMAFPDRSIAFLQRLGAAGTLLAPPEVLGYTLWRLAPSVAPADGRAEIALVLRRRFEPLAAPAEGPWLLAFRARDEAVYVHADAGALVDHVEALWEGLGVPFDDDRGLLVGAAIAKSPEWAVHEGLLDPEGPAQLRAAQGPAGPARAAARATLAKTLYLAGDLVGAVAAARGALVDRPDDPAPLLWAARALAAQGAHADARVALERARGLGADTTALEDVSEVAR